MSRAAASRTARAVRLTFRFCSSSRSGCTSCAQCKHQAGVAAVPAAPDASVRSPPWGAVCAPVATLAVAGRPRSDATDECRHGVAVQTRGAPTRVSVPGGDTGRHPSDSPAPGRRSAASSERGHHLPKLSRVAPRPALIRETAGRSIRSDPRGAARCRPTPPVTVTLRSRPEWRRARRCSGGEMTTSGADSGRAILPLGDGADWPSGAAPSFLQRSALLGPR